MSAVVVILIILILIIGGGVSFYIYRNAKNSKKPPTALSDLTGKSVRDEKIVGAV